MHNILIKQVLIPLHFISHLYLTPSTSNTPLITPLSPTQRAQNRPLPSKYSQNPFFIAKIDTQSQLYLMHLSFLQKHPTAIPQTDQKPHH
jgi:hypothetical protein